MSLVDRKWKRKVCNSTVASRYIYIYIYIINFLIIAEKSSSFDCDIVLIFSVIDAHTQHTMLLFCNNYMLMTFPILPVSPYEDGNM